MKTGEKISNRFGVVMLAGILCIAIGLNGCSLKKEDEYQDRIVNGIINKDADEIMECFCDELKTDETMKEVKSLFNKIDGIIGPEDFVDELYQEVAGMVFEEYKRGNINPAQILNRFIEGEEQYREVASLFHASLSESLNNDEQKKAFSETVKKIKKNSLEMQSRKATDIAQLQKIIKQQSELANLRISLD